ncbi:DUF4440 domain-containing protein [Nocardia panacis]|uniref:DUF4440 domain-containing protein n=1 Tax=Nocardia panacis TaxID=2340916 RepID=A0A3A4KCJ6_9NOCA|nr:DUF4440 domain-containing protein [Nocardia panacis]RJO76381.1 DUF4440 domain-containing protein [Nocardia panacis]
METQGFIDEIIDFHVAVTELFAGTAPDRAGAVDALLDRFDPEFTMITPVGGVLTKAGLRNLFQDGFGKTPDLVIDITEIVPIATTATSGLVRYAEFQRAGTDAILRRSTAYFVRAEGRVLWRHLHETFADS